MWVRWTLPRLRIDQVLMTCMKYLLPISCVLMLGVSFWRLAVPELAQYLTKYVLTAGSLILVLWSDPSHDGLRAEPADVCHAGHVADCRGERLPGSETTLTGR